MTIKTDILKAFLENSDLYEFMKNCNHYNSINEPNPYHLEGDVWTHTMLVYNAANPESKAELIMALCHDIGKILTRNFNEKNNRVSFYGHADASIQPTIDFICYLYDKGILSKNDLELFMMYRLPAMANHMLYYQNYNKLNLISGNNLFIKYYLKKMSQIDGEGSISKTDKIEKSNKNLELIEFTHKKWDDSKSTITIWTGLPGSGKDYLAKKTNKPILSFDDIRVEYYKEKNKKEDWINLKYNDIYINAFKYCNEKKINLNNILRKKAKVLLNKGLDINICNTSLTRKSRRSIINTIGTKYNYIINQVFVPTKTIKERNNTRNKKIPFDVIKRMMLHMTVATHFEEHINEINYILNL